MKPPSAYLVSGKRGLDVWVKTFVLRIIKGESKVNIEQEINGRKRALKDIIWGKVSYEMFFIPTDGETITGMFVYAIISILRCFIAVMSMLGGYALEYGDEVGYLTLHRCRILTG